MMVGTLTAPRLAGAPRKKVIVGPAPARVGVQIVKGPATTFSPLLQRLVFLCSSA